MKPCQTISIIRAVYKGTDSNGDARPLGSSFMAGMRQEQNMIGSDGVSQSSFFISELLKLCARGQSHGKIGMRF